MSKFSNIAGKHTHHLIDVYRWCKATDLYVYIYTCYTVIQEITYRYKQHIYNNIYISVHDSLFPRMKYNSWLRNMFSCRGWVVSISVRPRVVSFTPTSTATLCTSRLRQDIFCIPSCIDSYSQRTLPDLFVSHLHSLQEPCHVKSPWPGRKSKRPFEICHLTWDLFEEPSLSISNRIHQFCLELWPHDRPLPPSSRQCRAGQVQAIQTPSCASLTVCLI